jgi:hypothetical protein
MGGMVEDPEAARLGIESWNHGFAGFDVPGFFCVTGVLVFAKSFGRPG